MMWITLVGLLGLVAGAPVDQQHVSTCEVCHLLVGELQDYLTTDQSKTAIETYVTDICTKLASDEKEACLHFNNDYAGVLFSKLNNDLRPEQFCQTLPGVCPKQREPEQPLPVTKVEDDAGCEICQLLVTYLDTLLKDNGTEAEINKTLYQICDASPDGFKQTCYGLVTVIEGVLQAGVDPKMACVATSFCPNATITNACDMCKLAAFKNKHGIFNDMMLDTTCSKLCSQTPVNDDPPRTYKSAGRPCDGHGQGCKEAGCAACKLLITGLDTIVGANVTVDTINNTITDICNRMAAKNTADACLNIVPKVVELMKTGVSPVDACSVVGLCDTEVTVPQFSTKRKHPEYKTKHKINLNNIVKNKKVADTPGCILCKDIGAALNTILTNNITVSSLNDTLQDICTNLPADSLKEACFGAVPNILKISKTGLNVTDLCVKTNLCESQGMVHPAVQLRKVRSVHIMKVKINLRCDICQFVTSELDKVLADNATQETINATVYGLCDKLSGAFQDLCLESAPSIVDTVEQGVNSDAVCKQLELCDNVTAIEIQRKPKENGDLKCDVCKYIATEVDKRIGTNATKDKINSTVYEICDKLTGSLAVLCKVAAPEIVKQLANGGDPEKVCEAVKLCTQTVGQKISEKLKTDGDLQCDICKYLITEAEKRLTLNETIQKINYTMFNLCSDLFGNLKKICYAAAPQIVTALQGGEDPGKVCYKVKFCPSGVKSKDTGTSRPVMKVSNNVEGIIECEICKLAVKEVDELIKRNTSGKDINSTVYEVCGKLSGTLQTLCLTYSKDIVNALESGVDPDKACDFIKLCPATEASLSTQKLPNINAVDIPCDVCEFAIQELDKVLADSSSAPVINSTVYSACEVWPGFLRTFCYAVAPSIVTAIENGADPLAACQAFTLCPSTDNYQFNDDISKENEVDLKCDVCEFAVQEADKVLADNSSAPVINSTIYSVCNALPGTLQTLCYGLAPNVVTAIENGADPLSSCQALTLCPPSTVVLEKFEPKRVAKIEKDLVDVKCDVCEFAVQEADKYLAENSTVTVINTTVYTVCNTLPGTLQVLCNSLAPQLVQTLKGGADPLKACQLITWCPAQGVSVKFEPKPVAKIEKDLVDVKCDVCEFAVQEADKYLAENSTVTVINTTVYTVCNTLPGTLQVLCNSLAPQLVQTLKGGADPLKACQLITLCPSQGASVKFEPKRVAKIEHDLVDVKCDVCEFAVQEADKYLAENSTVTVINTTVYTVCNTLPGTLQVLCNSLAPQLVQTLKGGADPLKACQLITWCPAQGVSVKFEPKPVAKIEKDLIDVKCDVCEFAVQEADKYLAENSTVTVINTTVYTVCNTLPGTLQVLCNSLAPQLVQTLKGGADPLKACQLITLCPSQGASVKFEPKRVAKIEHDLVDVKCDVCEFAVQEADKYLAENSTVTVINTTVYTVCNTLPGTLQVLCNSLAPQLVQTLKGGADPLKACQLITLCPSQVASVKFEPKRVAKIEHDLVDVKCDVCEFAVQEADKYLAENSTTAVINSTVYTVCNTFTGTLQLLCNSLAPQLVQTLKGGADPLKACQLITLCPAQDLTLYFTSQTQLVSKTESKVSDAECDLCEFTIKELDSILANNASAEKINATVYGLCSVLPDSLKLVCLGVAPQIVSGLENGVDPEKACTAIGLCTNMTSDIYVPHDSYIECHACEQGLNEVLNNVHQDYAKVEGLLLNLCGRLPAIYQSVCKSMVEEDNGVTFKSFLQSYSPDQMCEMAKCMGPSLASEMNNRS